VDCVFPFPKEFSVDRIVEFLKAKNTRSFRGIVNLENQIKIKDDVVVVVNGDVVLTHFFKSQSFNEYFEMS
jgi:hypothetical protein